MSKPTIYCDRKQVLPNEEITVFAGGNDLIGNWFFPNIDMAYLELIPLGASLDENVLTFKCLKEMTPLIIGFKVLDNEVLNATNWGSTILPGVADYWVVPTSGQDNVIYTGWNFDGTSQRVTQTAYADPWIRQDDLILSSADYSAEIDYRASSDIELKVGGHIFPLTRTNEGLPFAIYPIVHGEETVDFLIAGGTNIEWILADGSYVTGTSSISKYLPAGTSYLIVDNFVGTTISSVLTESNYVGSLSDIPSGVAHLELLNTNVTGNIYEIDHITNIVFISNALNINGSIASLAGVSSVIDLRGCTEVDGDLADLVNTDKIVLDNCAVDGIISPLAETTYWSLNYTLLNKEELEASLINVAQYAINNDISNGHFECYDEMPTIDGLEPCMALNELLSRGWEVRIHHDCHGGSSEW